MMDRLTKSGAISQQDIDELMELSNENQFGRNDAYFKLQHYEDLTEAGRLMELPDTIELGDRDFGLVIASAARYALGRQTYMPGVVIGMITPLLPWLCTYTLKIMRDDIKPSDDRHPAYWGNVIIDKPDWMAFLNAIANELERRNED